MITQHNVQKDVAVAMRDGVVLKTDVYRPVAARGPALLTRTPYDKSRLSAICEDLDITRAVQAGFTVVVQDVRGRFASEGLFDAHGQEARDGVDTLQWLVAQEWCDGRVGMFGKSYLGGTQWFLAGEQPEQLLAIAPSMTPSDGWEGMFTQGGVTALHTLRWAAGVGGDNARKLIAQGHTLPEEWAQDFDFDTAVWHLPLSDHPAYSLTAPFWPQWITRPDNGPFWRSISPNARYDRIRTPALNIGGWFDIFTGPVIENFQGARSVGSGNASKSRLIIGPWSHANLTGTFPEHDFGPNASAKAIDLHGIQLKWFQKWLCPSVDDGESPPPVLIFVMGTNQWRQEFDWPIPGTRFIDFHLSSGGHANTRHGDGALSSHSPVHDRSDTFVSDPNNPTPTTGGQVLLPGERGHGPRDQRAVEDRDDVLVYSTPLLERAVEVIGPVGLKVFLSSTAPDTDLFAKLVDVFPDGRAINLTSGMRRLRYRHSTYLPEMMTPGEVYEVDIDVWATANVFQPGHCIRLEISSSNFPGFGRNSGTGGDIGGEPPEAYRAVTNTIHHGLQWPSRLKLPVIER